MTEIINLQRSLEALRDSADAATILSSLPDLLRAIPTRVENLDLFELGLALIERIDEPSAHRNLLLAFVRDIPRTGLFEPLYQNAMDAVVTSTDAVREGQHRTHELLGLAHDLPTSPEFLPLRIRTWKLALGLPERPRFRQPSLKDIAWELPKSSDYSFYRRYTLLGVARELPKEGPFLEIFREAINLAMDAVAVIPEPYYRKYALFYIANELRMAGEFPDLYLRVVTEACGAACAIGDPLAREHALVELLRELPKTPEFSELLMDATRQALDFFTVRKWMEDVDATDVVDFILSAPEPGIKDSKKRRYSREKFSAILSAELDRFGTELTDVRFIEVLRPYTHIWIQPKSLRDSVRSVVAHLESLKERYHGREILRPVFVREAHPPSALRIPAPDAAARDCIAIDLGATNTVIMRKKGTEQPEFVVLPAISKKHDSVCLIPTILSTETNSIGTEVIEENPVTNIKQLLLDRNPKGKTHMERFLRSLSQHLKRATTTGGWFSMASRSMTEVLYISAPVGFQYYKKTIRDIAQKAMGGVDIEIIEEPLAAAIGYQVVEERDRIVLIVDFGGSTMNTMIVRVNSREVHVVAKPERSQMLGGHDIDHWLSEHLAQKIGLPEEAPSYRLLALAEGVKVELSRKDVVSFEWQGEQAGTVSKEEFEEVLDRHDFYRNIDRALSNVLKKAEKVGVRKDRIEAVLLTGGSSQIPSFKDKIGHLFPELRRRNLIYDHNPLSAVALGAALYGTKEITDRHLSMAYAVRYTTDDPEAPFSYSIILEKGESLPVEKTYRIGASHKLGRQREMDIQLFEVPESLVVRRWVAEAGIEFITQELQQPKDATLAAIRTVTLSFDDVKKGEIEATFHVAESGQLSVTYEAGGDGIHLDAGIWLR